ncbi:MAG: HAMP domain-containing histidine kinase, partial [Spirochaetales bacterium]|nr:HAMP domain-containing histidine kinase [Spirochaetales bacterium]
MKGRVYTLFGKLFAVYGLTLFLLLTGFLLFRILSATDANESISSGNLYHYAELLTDRIGTPPAKDIWEKTMVETGILIRIEGPDGFVLRDDAEETRESGEILNPESGWLSLFFYSRSGEQNLILERGEYRYIYSEFHGDYRLYFLNWVILFLFFLTAVTINYLLVRHLLSPLRKMSRVAAQFGRNDWKARVRPRGRDELALLGNEIDLMADRIVGHIGSMQDLLYSVSHEFRSPLTRMKLLLEFMDEGKGKESLGEEIDYLDRLTGSLLERKRLEEGQGLADVKEQSLHDLAGEYLASSRKKDLPLKGIFSGTDCKVRVDKARILLALSNLVENALKYAPGSGVTLEVITADREDFCRIQVSDEGPGLPDSVRESLGVPFTETDRNRGFGLGLSIVKAV